MTSNADIVRLYREQRYGIRKLAAVYGLKEAAIRKILREQGVELRKIKNGRPVVSDEDLRAAYDRIKMTMSTYHDEAKKLGLRSADALRGRFETKGWLGVGITPGVARIIDRTEARKREAYAWFGEAAERMVR